MWPVYTCSGKYIRALTHTAHSIESLLCRNECFALREIFVPFLGIFDSSLVVDWLGLAWFVIYSVLVFDMC